MSVVDRFSAETRVRARQVLDERVQHATSEAEAIEAVRGESYEVFRCIDEIPGYFTNGYGEGWTWLRRARNNPDSNLFDVLVRA